MVKVLEHGIRKITCPYCKAKLQYEHDDIQTKRISLDFAYDDETKYIICPDCGGEIYLTPIKRL